MPKPENITTNEACISRGLLVQYIEGKANPEETRKIEIHISECLLCGDAVEGLIHTSNLGKLPVEFAGLEKQILEKYSKPPGKIFSLWQKLSAVAAVVLFFGIGIFFLISDPKPKEHQSPLAQTQENTTPISEKNTSGEAFNPEKSQEIVADNSPSTQQKQALDDKGAPPLLKVEPPRVQAADAKAPEEEAKQAFSDTEDEKEGVASPKPAIQPSDIAGKKEDATKNTYSEIALDEKKAPSVTASPTSPVKPVPTSAPIGEASGSESQGKADTNADDLVLLSEEDNPYKEKITQAQIKKEKIERDKLEKGNPPGGYQDASAFSVFQQGLDAKKNGNHLLAIDFLSKVPVYDKKYEDAQWEMADCYIRLGDTEKANLIYDGMAQRKSKYTQRAKKARTSKK